MKIAIAGLGYVGLSNAVLLAQHNEVVGIDLDAANLVQALDLKEGEEIDLHMVGARAFEVTKKPGTQELLERLHQFRGRLPADFHFDRLRANQRDSAA